MGGWNPWRALREREHIDFRLAPLPYDLRGVYWPRGDRTAIVLSPTLTRVERNAALAHELVHDERGGGCGQLRGLPPELAVLARKEETRVHRIVAARLIPIATLQGYVDRLVELGEPITPAGVAEEFDTTEDVAATALDILRLKELP